MESLTNKPSFCEDDLDAFGEIVNIAMGQAGSLLAEAFSGFVHLQVPNIRTIKWEELQKITDNLISKSSTISAVRQEFMGEFSGFIMVIYGCASYAILREILGFDDRESGEVGKRQREELLLELSNSLASTCTMKIASQLKLQCGLKPPRIVAVEQPSKDVVRTLFGPEPTWSLEQALQIDILFHLDGHDFPFELLITVSPESLPLVQKSIARLLT